MARRIPWDPHSPHLRRALPRAHAGWWVLALLAGLFAMHGLDMHGTHATDAATPPTGHDPQAQTAHHAPPAEAPVGGVDSSVALGLCLTVLGAGILWLGAARVRHRTTRGVVSRRSTRGRVPLLATARDLSPPTRAQLSVWRC